MKAIIPFNKPFMVGKELENIRDAIASGQLSGGGKFSRNAQNYFEKEFNVKKALLTPSCTDALELIALLLNIQPGDEIIAPSFAFVSTVNPFVLRGAKIIFADSREDHPNIDVELIEGLITPKTRAVICVHYSGMACDMDRLTEICNKNKIHLVEDAAHAIGATWNNSRHLGSIGTFGAFSFHETKNVIAGEGGMLCVNDESFFDRCDIISDKGTDRKAFFSGKSEKYQWVDYGSSFLASELTAAFLVAQLEEKEKIQAKRIQLWNSYYKRLSPLAIENFFSLPFIPAKASNNGHIFYLVTNNSAERNELIKVLQEENIYAVFHYQSLHRSPFYQMRYGTQPELRNADHFSNCLLRLPLFFELGENEIDRICSIIEKFYLKK
jgi:dTDP-4-amino-4,6-dideoxygalactose transaminase